MLNTLTLKRVPNDDKLKAWNAADELLLNRLDTSKISSLLIVNDSFGALCVALKAHAPLWWNDSAMSLDAVKKNAWLNGIPIPATFNTEENNQRFSHVVMHIPKSVRLFQHQLEVLTNHTDSDSKIFMLAMVKHVSKGHIKAMNDYFHNVNPGHAIKKSRVIEISGPKTDIPKVTWTQYESPEVKSTIWNAPGCFAEATVDPGAREFLNHFDKLPTGNCILDLGCGNGILSIALAKKSPSAQLHLVDESAQAIESARKNLVDYKERTTFYHSNGTAGLGEDTEFDLIVCNPPFHQQTTVTEEIAYKLFDDAQARLSSDGEFWLVANRHLSYFYHLKNRFKTVETMSGHAQFNVYRCLAPL